MTKDKIVSNLDCWIEQLEKFAELTVSTKCDVIEQNVLDIAMQYADAVWVRDILNARVIEAIRARGQV